MNRLWRVGIALLGLLFFTSYTRGQEFESLKEIDEYCLRVHAARSPADAIECINAESVRFRQRRKAQQAHDDHNALVAKYDKSEALLRSMNPKPNLIFGLLMEQAKKEFGDLTVDVNERKKLDREISALKKEVDELHELWKLTQ